MSLLYADSTAIVRCYFSDEPDHAELRSLLLEGDEPVVTSEIARLELVSAVRAASVARRIRRWSDLIAGIDATLADGGPVEPIALRADVILPAAHQLMLEHKLRTLDAIHLAVCVEVSAELAPDGDVIFVTRDTAQAIAARALGFAVR